MQRLTITLDDDLVAELDRLIARRGYQNRSEAMRDLARAGMRQVEAERGGGGECVAALIYVYDHEKRELAKRLTRSFHDHHDLGLATMHVHLDHESCLEVTVLRGATREVEYVADHVIAERGVQHGRLVTIPVAPQGETHSHGGKGRRHPHLHVKAG
jgi:CopG family nickel-responsive transcriptional regulator